MNTPENQQWRVADWKQQQQKISAPFQVINLGAVLVMLAVPRYAHTLHLSEDGASYIALAALPVIVINALVYGSIMYHKAEADRKMMEAHFAAQDEQLLRDFMQQP
ncbi:MAG: hypothetical protein JO316_10105 [Abitibacteriaceae bacterium]|nr:hypothetical protein [Abditibacteriaceae bacterium]